jgi:hypothetical protein
VNRGRVKSKSGQRPILLTLLLTVEHKTGLGGHYLL